MQENKDLILLKEAAYECGKIAKTFFRKNPERWEKKDKSGPVTEADIAINNMLQTELINNRPDFGWLSEETEDSPERLSHLNTFIIDPIDGTRSFISGDSNFSHSLAISRNGEIVAAVVYLPILDLMYTAAELCPSKLNGNLIKPSNTNTMDNSLILTTSKNISALNWKSEPPNVNIEYRSSLAYRLCLVADGQFDAVLTMRKCWEWDIAAGDLIIRKAGGQSTNKFGHPLRFNKVNTFTEGCVGAGIKLHKVICSKIV